MTHARMFVVLTACSLGVACSSEGTGSGELKPTSPAPAEKAGPVHFSWKSDGSSVTRGTMSAKVENTGVFQGKYMQITSEADASDTNAYFSDTWYPGWRGWDGWGSGGPEFVTNYSGRVIAVLRSDKGESMRCRFQLAEPSSGPAGGGIGECELSDGNKVNDVVLEGH
jgi:hypothetical protein